MPSKDYYIINFKAEQRRAIKIAKELGYKKYVIDKLKEAERVAELSSILRSAREGRI